jgi:hypothetical protein
MVTSLRERTAQNARSFKLSDRFERCANSFFWQFAHRSTLIFFHSENQRSLIAFVNKLCQNIKILQKKIFDWASIGGGTIFPRSPSPSPLVRYYGSRRR